MSLTVFNSSKIEIKIEIIDMLLISEISTPDELTYSACALHVTPGVSRYIIKRRKY
jgi:hypothetical protein